VVCLSVGLSVCLSVTVVSLAKTAEAIEMPFGMLTWLGLRNYVLDGVQIPMQGSNLLGGREVAAHCEVSGLSAVSCAKIAELTKMHFRGLTCAGSC